MRNKRNNRKGFLERRFRLEEFNEFMESIEVEPYKIAGNPEIGTQFRKTDCEVSSGRIHRHAIRRNDGSLPWKGEFGAVYDIDGRLLIEKSFILQQLKPQNGSAKMKWPSDQRNASRQGIVNVGNGGCNWIAIRVYRPLAWAIAFT